MSFKIKPLAKAKSEKSKIVRPLPQGSCLWIAPSNSGKTCAIINLLQRNSTGLRSEYERVHIMSPTIELDGSWDQIRSDPEFGTRFETVDRYDPEYLTELLSNQKRKIDEWNAYQESKGDGADVSRRHHRRQKIPPKPGKILVILDDCASELPSSSAQGGVLNELYFRGRHSLVWTWISAQSYKRVPRSIRLNAPSIVIFSRCSANEQKVIAEELEVERPLRPILKQMASVPFSFLYIDQRSQDRLWHNFERPVE